MLECSTGNSKSQLHKARLARELLRQSEATPQAGIKNGIMTSRNSHLPGSSHPLSCAEFRQQLPPVCRGNRRACG
jgi:hypothetical protein